MLCCGGLHGNRENFSFCGFRGKHRPAISIAGIFFCLFLKKKNRPIEAVV